MCKGFHHPAIHVTCTKCNVSRPAELDQLLASNKAVTKGDDKGKMGLKGPGQHAGGAK